MNSIGPYIGSLSIREQIEPPIRGYSVLQSSSVGRYSHAWRSHERTPTESNGLSYIVRPARAGELAIIPKIQLESRRLFESRDRTEVFNLPPVSGDILGASLAAGSLLVAEVTSGIVGFGVLEAIGDDSYLHQLSVRPAYSGRGIGASLLSELIRAAASRGQCSMTLITYSDIPWNMPFYAKHGFTVISNEDVPEYLAVHLAEERGLGIDMSHRVAMKRRIT